MQNVRIGSCQEQYCKLEFRWEVQKFSLLAPAPFSFSSPPLTTDISLLCHDPSPPPRLPPSPIPFIPIPQRLFIGKQQQQQQQQQTPSFLHLLEWDRLESVIQSSFTISPASENPFDQQETDVCTWQRWWESDASVEISYGFVSAPTLGERVSHWTVIHSR